MKKILYGFLALVIVLVLGIYLVLFTSFGNNLIADYAQKKIKELSGIEVQINEFKLRPSSLALEAGISNLAFLKMEGNLSLFKLGFDVDYVLNLDKNSVKDLTLSLQEDIAFKGKIKGVASDFSLSGNGKAFGSNIALLARILDYAPLDLKLDAKAIKVEELLALLSQPAYAKGLLHLSADVVAKDLKPDGKALINLDISSLNYTQIAKDFNLSLPNKTEPKAKIIVLINDDLILAQSQINNDFLNFNTQKTQYKISQNALQSDFSLGIENLSKLEKLIGTKASGTLNIDGNASLLTNALQGLEFKAKGSNISAFNLPKTNANLNAVLQEKNEALHFVALLNSTLLEIPTLQGYYKTSNDELSLESQINVNDLNKFKDLAGVALTGSAKAKINAKMLGSAIQNLNLDADIAGGKITALSNGKSLDANIDKLDLSKALALAAQPAYASGILNAKAHLSSLDFAKLNGNFTLSANGILGQKALSTMLNTNFPANTKYNLSANGDIVNNVINFTTNLKSDLANLNDFKGKFDINTLALNSTYSLDAYDFSKLNFLAGRKLSGKALFTGDLNLGKAINASIHSKNLFGGSLDSSLANNDFKANIAGVDFSSLMKGLDLPDYYEGKAAVNVNYNLLSENGKAVANLSNAKLKNTKAVSLLSTLVQRNLSADSFDKAEIVANINKNQITLNVSTSAKHIDFSINNGLINTKTSSLNLPFALVIDKANFKGSVTGTSENPSVKLDAGSLIKSAAEGLLGGKDGEKKTKKIEQKVDKEINRFLNKLF